MSIITDIVAGVLSPITNMVTAIFNKKEDTDLGKYKIDGKVDLSLVQAHVDIIKAQATLLNNKIIVWLQVAFGAPLAIYYGKCVFWDKVLKLGTTDQLDGYTAQFSVWIVSFLFLHSAITSWVRKT